MDVDQLAIKGLDPDFAVVVVGADHRLKGGAALRRSGGGPQRPIYLQCERERRPSALLPLPSPPDEGYLSLTIAEVLADLSSLDSEQLLMVKGLEEAGERRTVILDRIGDLLVVQEAAQHRGPRQRSPLLSHRPHPL